LLTYLLILQLYLARHLGHRCLNSININKIFLAIWSALGLQWHSSFPRSRHFEFSLALEAFTGMADFLLHVGKATLDRVVRRRWKLCICLGCDPKSDAPSTMTTPPWRRSSSDIPMVTLESTQVLYDSIYWFFVQILHVFWCLLYAFAKDPCPWLVLVVLG
jgi:hypothetical protein